MECKLIFTLLRSYLIYKLLAAMAGLTKIQRILDE